MEEETARPTDRSLLRAALATAVFLLALVVTSALIEAWRDGAAHGVGPDAGPSEAAPSSPDA